MTRIIFTFQDFPKILEILFLNYFSHTDLMKL